MSRNFAFAHAPPPAPDEVLGSWLVRLARRHGVSAAAFLLDGAAPGEGHGDLDWRADPALVAWLGYGSGIAQERLAQMTLQRRFPSASPDDFAWSHGSAFVGRHAFCPACAREELKSFGAPVSRCADAGLWRLACGKHGVYLVSVNGPPVGPEFRSRRHRPVTATPAARAAPPFARAFERAVVRAQVGADVGPAWRVRAPVLFLSLSLQLASLMLVQRRPGQEPPSAAAILLGDDVLRGGQYGAAEYNINLIRSVASYARVRAFSAAALLMLTQVGARRLRVATWAKQHSPFNHPLLIAAAPWEVAADAWGRKTLECVAEMAPTWPWSIAHDARIAVRRRLRLMGAV